MKYANVASSLALFLALCGTAGAATGIIGIDFHPYEYGLGAYTSYRYEEHYVGADGEPGGLGVRSRQPNGNPKAGALLYARDYADTRSIGLDYRDAARPRLISESGTPFRIETGSSLILSPGGSGAVDVRGYLTLQNLSVAPSGAPVGTVALVDGRLRALTASGWATLR